MVKDVARKYFEKFDKAMDMSACPYSDLSVLIGSMDDVFLSEDLDNDVKSLAEAMEAAGFYVAPESFNIPAVVESSPTDDGSILIGVDATKTAKMMMYNNYVEDIKQFKESILDVAYNFALKNGTHPGLALSLFAAEWDRYHSARGIPADLRSLRERFGVVKLMPFLQSIPDLDVVGTHPEVRVRIKDGMPSRPIAPSPRRKMTPSSSWYASTPNTSTHEGYSGFGSGSGGLRNLSLVSELGGRSISLNSELFGEPTAAEELHPEAQTRTVLEQMLNSTQAQILDILSHVPADPLSAAAAIEKMNELQVLVNALKAALAVLPSPPAAVKKTPISIESALFGPSSVASSSKRTTINLESMLDDGPPVSQPPTPVTAASSTAPQVGPLLSDLSRILFAQVIQQQHSTAPELAAETNAALERTLAEIISAASSPPCSPVSGVITMDSVVSGQLVIPNSLPSSPIEMATSPMLVDDAATMHQLLKGLMSALPPPPELDNQPLTYHREFMLSVRKSMAENGLLSIPPREIAGLCCRQVLRTVPHHKRD